MSKRLTLEYVDQCFKEGGCILLETEYINSKTKLFYIYNLVSLNDGVINFPYLIFQIFLICL